MQLTNRLVDDLKEARERLNQNPSNSSRPSGSQDPWFRAGDDESTGEMEDDDEGTEEVEEEEDDGSDRKPAIMGDVPRFYYQ